MPADLARVRRSAATRHRTLFRWDGPSAPSAAQLKMNDAPRSNRSPYCSATPCTPTALLSLRLLGSIDGVCSLLHSYRHPTRNRPSWQHGFPRRALSRPGSDVLPRPLPCGTITMPCLSSHVQRMFCSAVGLIIRPCWGAMGTLTPDLAPGRGIRWGLSAA